MAAVAGGRRELCAEGVAGAPVVPGDRGLRRAGELDLVVRAVDLDVHVHGGRLRQRLEQGGDGRDRGLVGGEPPVVRRPARGRTGRRAGHRELVTRLGPLRPRGRRALAVQQELDLQGLGGRVVAARGVGADRGPRSLVGVDGAVRRELGEARRVLAVGGQEHLEVRGRRGVREPVEVFAGDEHGHQPGRDRGHGHDLDALRRLPPPRGPAGVAADAGVVTRRPLVGAIGPGWSAQPARGQCRRPLLINNRPRRAVPANAAT